ncbi:ATP-binding cassette domain-containing protein [Streptosporangium sp. NPDC050855]|uniref:ATP-binding cassette domain-containing protein n=1 Tax=Streptosporangium sp. NPDC050855 TaxID=3366194 RepID=UPI003791F068
MIEFKGVSKRYGDKVAVDRLTVTVRPGHITGLLGPNGAGKSTSMRLLLGLDRPTSGEVTIGGIPYARLRNPLRVVGAHLDGRAAHPGRTARSHLLGLARYNGIPAHRVDEVLDEVGLTAVARRRVGGFSLGMGQRVGIAAALLGDPRILVLDEPVNGLDTDGVRWMRGLLRRFAADGRTVLVSSHLMAEMHQTADRVVVLGRGRLLADCPVSELTAGAENGVIVRTPAGLDLTAFTRALRARGMTPETSGPCELTVGGGSAEAVGDIAFAHRVPLHTLATVPMTLEQGYLRLVQDDVEYTTATTGGTAA